MKHLKRPRTIIILLLLVCGGLLAVILRQRASLDQFARYGESDKQNNLADAALTLDDAQRHVPNLDSDRQMSPGEISDDLEEAAADLKQVQIHLDAYETVRQRANEQPIILFDSIVFGEYTGSLRGIASELKKQTAVSTEQRTILAAIAHDLDVLHDVIFNHVLLVQEARGQQADQPLPRLADSIQPILPTLKFNSVRHELGLFPSISPQQDWDAGANQFSLTLGASTTCAEVGQPVTFTLELRRSGADDPPISLESVDIVIAGGGREERWSDSGGAPKPGEPVLASGDSRSYEWVWTASEQFSNTTVLVEARAKQPQDGPRPTPDPNGVSQDNPVTVDLKLGVGALTQSQQDRLSWFNHGIDSQPRTLPCAQMMR